MEETNTDIFSEFDELDTLDNTYEYTFTNFQDLIEEAKTRKEGILMDSFEAPLEEELNTTKDISLIQDSILDKLDSLRNEPALEIKEKPKEEENYMQKAFIYTAIIGFSLLMIAWGIYLFIITH